MHVMHWQSGTYEWFCRVDALELSIVFVSVNESLETIRCRNLEKFQLFRQCLKNRASRRFFRYIVENPAPILLSLAAISWHTNSHAIVRKSRARIAHTVMGEAACHELGGKIGVGVPTCN